MRKLALSLSLFCAVFFSVISVSAAGEAKPAKDTSLQDIKKLLGLSIYLQGGYTYNLSNPDSQENRLRVFDHKANSFTLDLAQILFNKDAATGNVGYRLKVSAGETAKFIHATGLGSTNAGESPHEFDLTEAYLGYIAPLGNGLKVQFGKFVTMHGAEVIEAKDNMNYSRSLLFNFAIPFTHTGLMAGYPFSDKVSANFYVVNGWDNFNDEGNSKTLGLSVNVTPAEQFSAAVNLMNGREQDLQTGIKSNRFLSDTVITVKPVKKVTFVVNTDYALQSRSAPDGRDAKWYGVAGYVKYDFTDLFSTAVRAEYFKDPEGARTGTAQAVKEVTLTPEFKAAKDLVVRPEYRHDWSDKDAFDSHRDILNKKTQDTIALGVMYTW
ncbi:MAG TPA: porin [Dissulfurispiraceae bacterium]